MDEDTEEDVDVEEDVLLELALDCGSRSVRTTMPLTLGLS